VKLQKLYSNYDYKKYISCFSLILVNIGSRSYNKADIFWVSKRFFTHDANIYHKCLSLEPKFNACFILETDKLLFSIL
jgi:hypothetical protein